MFWKRYKTVRVEITTPISIKQPLDTESSSQGKEAAKREKRIDADLTFKFATFTFLILQAILIIRGYLELAAYYEQFGIATSELDLSTPTLLVYGYSYTFSGLMAAIDLIPIIGAFIPTAIFIAIGAAATFLYVAMHQASPIKDRLQSSLLVGTALLLIFIAPVLAVHNGVDRAERRYEAETGVKASYGIFPEHSIVTDQKETLTGRIVVADTKSTFIQVKDTVYKIDNASNRVMRKTLIKPKLPKESGKSPLGGRSSSAENS
ncbi:hypothetical protein [Pseudomonas sp. Irchel 3A5]|uniref:hypothetical protein n=1 Tax=Pseudomonas sp. Irchel 3A5 TaxID=2008911 RepID=UPI0015954AC0|nr:hypothetical protein [Pseudomonas sp. Irchel 3A5]